MSPDTDVLLSFLSRPRTLDEVARRFSITPSEAERLVMKAAESGQIFISSTSKSQNKTLTTHLRVRESSQESLSSGAARSALKRGLVLTSGSTFKLKASVKRDAMIFKLRPDKPNLVHRNSSRLQVSQILGIRESIQKNRETSLAQELHILDTLSSGQRSLDELRAIFEVSRTTLGRMMRRGLICCGWGPKGIGNFYEITQRGSKELERLRLASSLGSGIVRKRLIPLKVSPPPIAS